MVGISGVWSVIKRYTCVDKLSAKRIISSNKHGNVSLFSKHVFCSAP